MIAPHIETERLILRGALASDHPALSIIRAKEEVGQHVGGVKTPQQCWSMILQTIGMWQVLGYGYWVFELKETGQVIGEVGFADFKRAMDPDISGQPEAGWVLDSSFWGKGIVTEAVRATHHWLDTETDYTRSTCIIAPMHAPSINVAKKCGYKAFALSEYNGEAAQMFERHRPGS